jgi:hypothetical protein
MYKSILLTDSEIKLLRKVLHTHLHTNPIDIKHQEIKNLHIIDRTLLGTIPTKNKNQMT